jgi:hypothetical protein
MSSGIGLSCARAAVAVTINAERTANVDFSGAIRMLLRFLVVLPNMTDPVPNSYSFRRDD